MAYLHISHHEDKIAKNVVLQAALGCEDQSINVECM